MKTTLPASTIAANVTDLKAVWFKPCEVSKITGLDEKWLEAARQGKKEIYGPPFVKIGTGKTAPIRYPVNELYKWMESFPLQKTIQYNSPHTSFLNFRTYASGSELWPFVLYQDGSLDEIFSSINSYRFMMEFMTRKIIWLSHQTITQNTLVNFESNIQS